MGSDDQDVPIRLVCVECVYKCRCFGCGCPCIVLLVENADLSSLCPASGNNEEIPATLQWPVRFAIYTHECTGVCVGYPGSDRMNMDVDQTAIRETERVLG